MNFLYSGNGLKLKVIHIVLYLRKEKTTQEKDTSNLTYKHFSQNIASMACSNVQRGLTFHSDVIVAYTVVFDMNIICSDAGRRKSTWIDFVKWMKS